MGLLIIVFKANTLVEPICVSFQARLMIMIARGNSYAIIVAISRCAPTIAYGDPEEKPPRTIARDGTIKRYKMRIRSPPYDKMGGNPASGTYISMVIVATSPIRGIRLNNQGIALSGITFSLTNNLETSLKGCRIGGPINPFVD